MRNLNLCCWFAAFMSAIALIPRPASAQETDSLSITGTFSADALAYPGIIGPDLALIMANGHQHAWTLTLHGVSYSNQYYYSDWPDSGINDFSEEYFTNVHATSFDLQFVGPDADLLNAVVSAQLTADGGSVLTLWNGDYFDSNFPDEGGLYSSWSLYLPAQDPLGGISFDCQGHWAYGSLFSTDGSGFPLVEPQRVQAFASTITDLRPGYSGGVASFNDFLDIGSSEPPVLLPELSIADVSVGEGNKGTTRLLLTVTLSSIAEDLVMVNFITADGTALAKQDYSATSGTLLFQPGQTSRTISLAIKADRKREPNETFSVRLSNAGGATINDETATVTILNDD
jgi:hypothetical protein